MHSIPCMPLELYQRGVCPEMPRSLLTDIPTTSFRLLIRAQVKAPTSEILISLWSLTERGLFLQRLLVLDVWSSVTQSVSHAPSNSLWTILEKSCASPTASFYPHRQMPVVYGSFAKDCKTSQWQDMGLWGLVGRERNVKLDFKWMVPGASSCSAAKPESMLYRATSRHSYWEIQCQKAGANRLQTVYLEQAERSWRLRAALSSGRDGAEVMGGHCCADDLIYFQWASLSSSAQHRLPLLLRLVTQ